LSSSVYKAAHNTIRGKGLPSFILGIMGLPH